MAQNNQWDIARNAQFIRMRLLTIITMNGRQAKEEGGHGMSMLTKETVLTRTTAYWPTFNQMPYDFNHFYRIAERGRNP